MSQRSVHRAWLLHEWASTEGQSGEIFLCKPGVRIEGVTASIHKCYVDAHGKMVAEDDIFKTPCVLIIFDQATRYREAQSNFGGKQMRRTVK